jgi:predicted transglutaminase-like cysteine proteinase
MAIYQKICLKITNVISKIMHFLFVIIFVLIATSANADNTIFGYQGIRSDVLDGLPKWQRVLSKLRNDQARYAVCDRDESRCDIRNFKEWRRFIKRTKSLPKYEQIEEVNEYFNRWKYISDNRLWGMPDYWATPLEFLPRSGDCEDYSIIKFITLEELGFRDNDLRIVILHDSIRREFHAVMSMNYSGQTLILDSLISKPLPDTEISHYKPYYSINRTSRWVHLPSIR